MGLVTPPHSPRSVRPPTGEDLAFARELVKGNLKPTPLLPAVLAGQPVSLKLECLQPTGSFKVRGALSAVTRYGGGPQNRSILAVSAGNHALGIAWAAARTGVDATVVIAETASPAKRAKLEQLPITLIRHGQSYDEAEAHALDLARSAGDETAFISAYNDPLVIAGASTVLDEIVDQHEGVGPLTVIVPAGGGGLLAGVALRASQRATPERPIEVMGVEAVNSPATSAALAAGRVVEVTVHDTIADGLSGNIEPGSVTIEVAQGRVAGMVAVTDEEIRAAIRFLVTEHGIVAEGAGAATAAAILAGRIGPLEGDVVAIVSGRNIALPLLAGILAGT